MYAIIETGGKQFRVSEGDELAVDLLGPEKQVIFDKVLLLNDGKAITVGSPHVKNCSVHAEVIGEGKGPKVIAFKYKKCKNYRRTVGHRQKHHLVKIAKIATA